MDPPLDAPARDPPSFGRNEQGSAISLGRWETFPEQEITPQRLLGSAANRENPFLPAFTSDPDLIRHQVEDADRFPRQLREPEPARIEQLQHGEIANREEIAGLGPLLGLGEEDF